jgi:hypothetical protein
MTIEEIRRQEILPAEYENLHFALSPLQKALWKADQRPFYDSDVEKYKAEQQARFTKTRSMTKRVVCGTLGIVVSLSAGVFIAGAFGWSDPFGDNTTGSRVQEFALALALIGMGSRFLMLSRPHTTGPQNLAWRMYRVGECIDGVLDILRSFTAPGTFAETVIPSYLIDAAEKIAATGIAATFSVEQLDTDPFLKVTATYTGSNLVRKYCANEETKETYYIGVWDENGFVV